MALETDVDLIDLNEDGNTTNQTRSSLNKISNQPKDRNMYEMNVDHKLVEARDPESRRQVHFAVDLDRDNISEDIRRNRKAREINVPIQNTYSQLPLESQEQTWPKAQQADFTGSWESFNSFSSGFGSYPESVSQINEVCESNFSGREGQELQRDYPFTSTPIRLEFSNYAPDNDGFNSSNWNRSRYSNFATPDYRDSYWDSGSRYQTSNFYSEGQSRDYRSHEPDYRSWNSYRFGDPNRKPLHRREKDPPTFDGKSVDFKDWIVQFEAVVSWNQWTLEESAQQMAMSLRGAAQKLLGDLSLAQINNYWELKSILSNRFDPQERETAYRCEFRNRVRGKGETTADYGYALRRLAYSAFPQLSNSAREPYVIDQYIHGLGNFDLQKHVQFHHPRTLEAAISLAVEYDAFMGSSSIGRKPKIESSDSDISEYPVFALGSCQNKAQSQKKMTDANSESKNSEIKELTQVMKDCFENLSKQMKSNSSKFRTRRRCFQCGDFNHLQFECPQKLKAQNNTEAKQIPENQPKTDQNKQGNE